MATMILKSAGKDGGCDPAQLAKRGWRNNDDVREPPTCITMLPQKNKDDDEIWVFHKYCKKEKEVPPTDEELNRLSRLFVEEIDKITDQEISLLVRYLPPSRIQTLLDKRQGINSEKRKASSLSSSNVVSIPFAYEGGDSRHCCDICGKKGHAVFDCSYWNFIPPGACVGPEYFVKCWICLQRVSQPVGVCDYCGAEGGVACLKVCIFCFQNGDHMPEECPRLKKQKTASETDNSDHPEKVHPWIRKTAVIECGIQSGKL